VDIHDCNGVHACELDPLFLAVADLDVDPPAMRATFVASADVRPVFFSLMACQRAAATSYSPNSFEIAGASRINLGALSKTSGSVSWRVFQNTSRLAVSSCCGVAYICTSERSADRRSCFFDRALYEQLAWFGAR
jgi:hypothetical protein